jgi:hypothetical protein
VWIASRNIYVEFDGVYWHGLDRPYDQLGPTVRRKYDRDRRCDAFCKAEGIVLVRVTDTSWATMTETDRRAWCDALPVCGV